jgi:hypothetical protein
MLSHPMSCCRADADVFNTCVEVPFGFNMFELFLILGLALLFQIAFHGLSRQIICYFVSPTTSKDSRRFPTDLLSVFVPTGFQYRNSLNSCLGLIFGRTCQ